MGFFDGVHVGHRQVIDGADTVLTFEPHPLQVIHPEAAPKLLMPFEIKRDVIEGLGVRFLVVDVVPVDSGWTVAVQSPDTAFFLLAVDAGLPTLESVVETALGVMRADYADLEFDERVDSVAGQPAIGHDVRFMSLDLTNTCWLRSFYCDQGTVLVMWQVNDLELEAAEPILKAICASLRVEED